MEKITRRHLKRFSASIKSRREEREVQVRIVHDRIPLFLNYDKRTLPIHPSTYDIVDTLFYVEGELVECCAPHEIISTLIGDNNK